jgi:RNA 3'-terminal phosphate cyclase
LQFNIFFDPKPRDMSSYFDFGKIKILDCEAIGTAATIGLLCQPRVIMKMIVEKQMECRLAGETEVLGEKTCPSATFVHHKIPHDQTRF